MVSSLFRPLTTALMIGGLLAVSGCTANPADQPSAEARPSAFDGVPLVPATGVYLGAYYGDGSVESSNEAIGRTPQLHLTYFGWDDPWTTDATLEADRDRGQISVVNWEPFGADFADIVSGRFDAMLTLRAREAAALTEPVFVDFAAEMNEEEGWGGHDPELYVAAYRHIHDIFAGSDGGNVVWVWAPNNVDSDGAPPVLDYYPGDEYVDWTGIDGYNWGTSDPGFEWQSFEEVFRDAYDHLRALGKPILIGETASAEEGGIKSEWIRAIVPTLETEFTDIRGVIWFDVDKERDWRIRSSDESAEALRRIASDPVFQTTAP
jgi:hypothetical protein